MEAKDNRKRAVEQIKRLIASKAEPDYSDINASTKVPRNKK